MDEHNINWALNKLSNKQCVARESKAWAGTKLVLIPDEHIDVKKGDLLYSYVKGSVIRSSYLATIKNNILRPYTLTNEDFNAIDWTLV